MTIYAKAPFKHVTEFNNLTIAELFATPEFAEAAAKSGGSYSYVGNSSSVTNIDWSVASVQELNIDNNPNLSFSDGVTGKSLTLLLKQQVSGQRSITWPSDVIWSNSTKPTLQNLISYSINPNFTIGTGFNNPVLTIVFQPDGKILVGGNFASYNGTTMNYLIRLNADGSIDTSFNTGAGPNSSVTSIVVQSDGKIIVGGGFTSFDSTSRNFIVRLNSDGSIDPTFNIGTGFDDGVLSIVLQPDGQILAAGDFTSYNGNSRSKIIRLNTDGSLDTSFTIGTGFIGRVASLSFDDGDWFILCTGTFTSYNGTTRNRIIRLNGDGSIDPTFTIGTGFNNYTQTSLILPDGKILVGGNFTQFNGNAAYYLARLNSDGTFDNTFALGVTLNSTVKTIGIQSDGKIVAGGDFFGTSKNYIIRLNTDGSVDTSSVTNAGFSSSVSTLAIYSDDSIFVGGNFGTFNSITTNYIVKLGVGVPVSYNLVEFYYNGANYVGFF
jgi:uncharacterized delta-60 repeat protein